MKNYTREQLIDFLTESKVHWDGLLCVAEGHFRVAANLKDVLASEDALFPVSYQGKKMLCTFSIDEKNFALANKVQGVKINLSKKWRQLNGCAAAEDNAEKEL